MIGKRRSRPAVCGGVFILMALCAAAPSSIRAQAPPGPMAPRPSAATRPAPPSQSQPAPPPLRTQRPPQEQSAPRQNIAGAWRLNRDASDDARSKITHAQHPTADRGNGPYGNGPYGGPLGGGYPQQYPGGGQPYPGGNGPYGNGPNGPTLGGRDDDYETQSPAMREYVYPALSINFSLQSSEADLTDDQARRRVFYTDGRKIQKSKDDNNREVAAHWEGNRLLSEEKNPAGGQLRRSYELSPDGRQLDEYVYLDATRSRAAVTIHYVYDMGPNRE